jgi:hypothetical protein
VGCGLDDFLFISLSVDLYERDWLCNLMRSATVSDDDTLGAVGNNLVSMSAPFPA